MSAEPAWDREQQRETPNSVEAEQALLGAIFVNNDAYYAVSDFLKPEAFYEPLHRKIFEVCAELIRMGKMASPITAKTFLPADEVMGDLTVGQYLIRLARSTATVINAPDYGQAILDMATRRSLISIGQDLIQQAYDLPVETPPVDLGERAMAQIASVISPDGEFAGAVSFGDALTGAIENANAAYMSDGVRKNAINYRFSPLERLIGPLFGGQLIICGGATKQGKTSLAAQVAIGAAKEGWPVWIYSGEMTSNELAMREISRDTKIPVWRQKRGELNELDFQRMVEFANTFKKLPILIQNKRLTIAGIRERARGFVRKRGRGVLIVDHIGLVERDKTTAKMSEWEFGQEVTRELKAIARDLDCPVIGCAQLKKNTFAENKGPVTEKFLNAILTRKPRYTDLIGAIERDADQVVIPFRPDVFLAEHEPTPGSDLYLFWEAKMNETRGRAKIVLALSREMHWPDSVDVGWDGPTTTFFETGGEEQRYGDPEFQGNPLKLF